LQVAVLVSVSDFAARPADHILLLQIHSMYNTLMHCHGQHAGLDAHELRELKFKDHDRFQDRLHALTAAHRAQTKANQTRKVKCEAECREFLEMRYELAKEAVKYEMLVKRLERLRPTSMRLSIQPAAGDK
jgi:hypothetical protein